MKTDDFFLNDEAAKSREMAKQRTQQEADDVLTLMRTQHGRRFVWRLLNRAGVFYSGFDSDSNVMSLKQGHREMGLWLLDLVKRHAFDEYLIMEKEARSNG